MKCYRGILGTFYIFTVYRIVSQSVISGERVADASGIQLLEEKL